MQVAADDRLIILFTFGLVERIDLQREVLIRDIDVGVVDLHAVLSEFEIRVAFTGQQHNQFFELRRCQRMSYKSRSHGITQLRK